MDLDTAFPPFGLRLTSGDLELRMPHDGELLALADVALAGLHAPGSRPFMREWNLGDPARVRIDLLQFHWRRRAAMSPESWALELVVLRDGVPIGVQGAHAAEFPLLRTAETESWLGLEYQGQGIGRRMRLMMLHLLFEGFGAVEATTGAFADNPQSNGLSRSLGYTPNGQVRHDREGEVATEHRFRMARETWDARPAEHRPDITLEGVGPVRAMLGMDEPAAVPA